MMRLMRQRRRQRAAKMGVDERMELSATRARCGGEGRCGAVQLFAGEARGNSKRTQTTATAFVGRERGVSLTRPSQQQHNKKLLQKTFVHLGSSPPKLLRRRRRRRLYDGAPLQNVCFNSQINRARGRYISRCL
jgi:hypothetical protein